MVTKDILADESRRQQNGSLRVLLPKMSEGIRADAANE